MRRADPHPAARLQHAVDLPEQRRVVQVLEHVLADDLDERRVLERQRQLAQVVHDVHARQRGAVEVDEAGQDLVTATDVDA